MLRGNLMVDVNVGFHLVLSTENLVTELTRKPLGRVDASYMAVHRTAGSKAFAAQQTLEINMGICVTDLREIFMCWDMMNLKIKDRILSDMFEVCGGIIRPILLIHTGSEMEFSSPLKKTPILSLGLLQL